MKLWEITTGVLLCSIVVPGIGSQPDDLDGRGPGFVDMLMEPPDGVLDIEPGVLPVLRVKDDTILALVIPDPSGPDACAFFHAVM